MTAGTLVLTFDADAPEVGDLHQYLGEHAGLVGPPPPHVELHGAEEERKFITRSFSHMAQRARG